MWPSGMLSGRNVIQKALNDGISPSSVSVEANEGNTPMFTKTMIVAAMVLSLAACSDDPTGTGSDVLSNGEQEFVTSLVADGDSIMQRHGAGPRHLLHRLKNAIEETGNEEALELLNQARDLREQARAARESGDTAMARDLFQQSGEAFFTAVVLALPDSPQRTGEAVDRVIERFQERLGDRDLPRVRDALNHAIELREMAEQALAEGNEVEAVQLNVRAGRVLGRIIHRARHHRDGPGDGGPEDGRPAGPPLVDELL